MMIRSPKLLKASKDRPCRRCGRNDGTCVPCHYTGEMQLTIAGKGKGVKGHDHIRATLCAVCHMWFDQYQYLWEGFSKTEASLLFLGYCMQEITDDILEGRLKL